MKESMADRDGNLPPCRPVRNPHQKPEGMEIFCLEEKIREVCPDTYEIFLVARLSAVRLKWSAGSLRNLPQENKKGKRRPRFPFL
jgi:hypothetical protein